MNALSKLLLTLKTFSLDDDTMPQRLSGGETFSPLVCFYDFPCTMPHGIIIQYAFPEKASRTLSWTVTVVSLTQPLLVLTHNLSPVALH